MSDETAFLEAIRTAPDDDTARLVFADWLDERGEGLRAMVIRRGVRKPKMFTFKEGEPARITFAQDGQDKRGDLPSYIDVTLAVGEPGVSWTTYKGTVHGAKCGWDVWRNGGDYFWMKHRLPRVELTTLPAPDVSGILYEGYDPKARSMVYIIADRRVALPESQVMNGPPVPGRLFDMRPFDELSAVALGRRWPGVTFEVPKLIAASWDSPPADIIGQLLAIREQMLARSAADPVS